MPDVEITYKDEIIVEMSQNGTKILKTSGKYCEDNITVFYTKPDTSYITVTTKAGALILCDDQSYQLLSSETKHTFPVGVGNHIVVVTYGGTTKTQNVLVDIAGVYEIEIRLSRLPDGYQEVEYLESTGYQWIDSNIIVDINTEVRCEVAATLLNDGKIFGSGVSGEYNSLFLLGTTNTLLSSVQYHPTLTDTLRHNIVFNNNNHQLIIDNVVLKTYNTVFISPSPSAFVFSTGQRNVTAEECSSIKLYSMTILNNVSAEILGEFVPCYIISNNQSGLYDIKNDVFLPNLGTKSFVVGADV